MDFSSKHYLENSKRRIDNLRQIVKGRRVAILAAGPSIYELEERITELRNADVCYFGMNSFIQEKNILAKIDEHFSVFFRSCRDGMQESIDYIAQFLKRYDHNIFISSFFRNAFGQMDPAFHIGEFLRDFDNQLLFFDITYDRTCPNKKFPLHFISGNSLSVVIQLAIIGQAAGVVLFGADGDTGMKEGNDIKSLWYRFPEYYNHWQRESAYSLFLDTTLCFNPTMPLAIRNVYETYNFPPIEILNCSENSFYNPFLNISYDDAFEYLITGKKVTKKSDKRTPKLSVITVALNTKGFLEETVENLMEQSYPNFEHIIVCEGEVDEIDDMKGRYRLVKWVCEKVDRWHEALRKGISAGKGEYIYYLPPGDSLANPDWLNICMDILENHPDISLVWGLSQELSEWNGAPGRISNSEFFHNPPPQGKDFIYYWLKRKYSFHPGSFCVRKSVLKECFPSNDASLLDERKAWLAFNYNLNTSGYLPFFVPLVATFRKTYFDQGGHRPQGDPIKMHLPYYVPITNNEEVREKTPDKAWDAMISEYNAKIGQYRNSILMGRVNHLFRDGFGQELEGNFRKYTCLFGDFQSWVIRKAPSKLTTVVARVVKAFERYQWGILKVGITKIWSKLKADVF